MADDAASPGILDGLTMGSPIEVTAVPAKKPKPRKKKLVAVTPVPILDAEAADAEVSVLLDGLNASELVALVRLNNLRANRTVERSVLREMILSGRQRPLDDDQSQLEWLRDEVQEFLDAHPLAGANPKVCPRNCHLHPDLYVLHCHAKMRTQLAAARNLGAVKRARGAMGERAQPRVDDYLQGDDTDGNP